jgi:hypothetical protein
MPAAARAKELPGITLSLEERIRVGFSRRMLMNARAGTRQTTSQKPERLARRARTRIMAALMVSETELVRLRVGIGGLLEYHPAAANENTREC